MYINELSPGEKIVIRVEKGTSTLELSTEVVAPPSNVDYLNIQQQEKKLHTKIVPVKLITNPKTRAIIRFPEQNIFYKAFVVRDKVPHLWKNIQIRRFEMSSCHLLISSENSHPTERRYHPRIPLGLPATARFLNGAGTLPVTIKNLSGGGIALVTDPNTDPGTVKTDFVIQDINFTDPETQQTFVLSAYVVRKTKYTNGKVLFGCKLNSKTLDAALYVQQKLAEKQPAE